MMVALWLLVSPTSAHTLRLLGTKMGTTYSVEIVGSSSHQSGDVLQAGIEHVLSTIEREMSTYRSDSELSRFNADRSTSWVQVSPDTARVVTEALRISRLSGGAFDVTVGPLVDLWGFGTDRNHRRRPSPDALESALSRVGFEKLEARESPAALRKRQPNLGIDLSAIAKGFGVDRVANHLENAGIASYLIEIGGELRGNGHNARGMPWAVAIEQPDLAPAEASSVIRLEHGAIATSGNYRNFFDEDGTRYSHVIDPRDGIPILHNLVSVTVVDATTMRADALATALLVLGPDDGPRLAQRQAIAALFVIRDGAGFRTIRTPSFGRYEVPLKERP